MSFDESQKRSVQGEMDCSGRLCMMLIIAGRQLTVKSARLRILHDHLMLDEASIVIDPVDPR